QPNEPINLCYDSFGPPAAMIRGLFEYLYRAEELVLLPHIPPGITQLQQHFPIRFGQKRLYLATVGSGPVTAVLINGQPWSSFDEKSITLSYNKTPREAVVQIVLGGAKPAPLMPPKPAAMLALPDTPDINKIQVVSKKKELMAGLAGIDAKITRIRKFYQGLVSAGLAESYEAAHARLAIECMAATCERFKMLSDGKLKRLPDQSQYAADKSYIIATAKLCEGLERTVASYEDSEDAHQKQIYATWRTANTRKRLP
ncbi:unnamed protein product, partial [marine sediment metagenome]